MRYFKIPYGKKVEDKIIGGKLTQKQGLYLGSIVVLFLFLFILNDNYIDEGNTRAVVIKLIVLITYSIPICILAFYKKDIYDLDEYLYMKIRFKNRERKTIYEKY